VQPDVSLTEAAAGIVESMNENTPYLGSEENNNTDSTPLATPPGAEVGEGTPVRPEPSPWAASRPEPAADPAPAPAPSPWSTPDQSTVDLPAAPAAPAAQSTMDTAISAVPAGAIAPVPQPPAAVDPAPYALGQPAGYPYPQGWSGPTAVPVAGGPVGPTGPVGPFGPLGTVGPVGPDGAAPVRRGGSRGRLAAVAGVAALAIALVAGGAGGVVGYELKGSGSSTSLQAGAPAVGKAAPTVDRSSLATIAAAIQPDVVVIETSEGEGSGVVLSADGYIVTNNHVVAGATANTVKVTFNSGKQVDASIVGTDPTTDLAVVKVPGVTGLSYANWGDSDDVQVGDTVLAIGSPLGLQGSVTAGIISALHRTIQVGGEQQQSQFSQPTASTTIGDAIQTDAPINPGNSGGALVDTNGKIVGINSAIATSGSGSDGNIGVGFAIPANKAKTVAQTLISGGKVSHPYLGISVGDATSGGAQVSAVSANSPAAKAGLQVGDVVTKVGAKAITTSEDLVGAVQSSSVGSTLSITVSRNGSSQTVQATVGETP
jgi:putative serine protease PepD